MMVERHHDVARPMHEGDLRDNVRTQPDPARPVDKVAYSDPAAPPQAPVLLEGGPAYAVITVIVVAILMVMYYSISNLG
jgi:hypothetical protein